MLLKTKQIWLFLIWTLLFTIPVFTQSQTSKRIETVQLKSNLSERVFSYNVILPRNYETSTTRYPVLYLLHGLFGHFDNWITHTNVVDYAAKYRIIIVMPEGGDGWYTDSATVPADKFESYIIKELIPDVENRFRTIRDRRGRAVAGLSMGGYGALKFGVKYPWTFALAASMSGALDPAVRSENNKGFGWDVIKPSIIKVYGAAENKTRIDNDLHLLVKNFPKENLAVLPYFYLDCGTEDGWLSSNRQLSDIFLQRKIPHEFRQIPGGHNWGYWDAQIQYVLALTNEKLSTSSTPTAK